MYYVNINLEQIDVCMKEYITPINNMYSKYYFTTVCTHRLWVIRLNIYMYILYVYSDLFKILCCCYPQVPINFLKDDHGSNNQVPVIYQG